MSIQSLPRRWLTRVDLHQHEDKILLLLSLVISAAVGLIVVAFVALTERMGRLLLTASPVERLLSPTLGSLIGGWLLFKYFPDARGSGIPQTRVALVLQNGVIRLRTVIGKFICSALSLGSGVALGREGPSVHIGAGIASIAGRRLGLSEENVRSLIPVGTAAAVAAAFNTPLAAVLFTLEEILADLHARVVGSVVIGACTSWIVLRLILGDEPLFHVPAYQLVHPLEFLIYAVLGLCGGIVSTGFVKLLLWQRAAFLKIPLRWKPYAPAAGGITVGLLALAVPGVLGVGYNLVSAALNGQMALKMMLVLLVLKMVATTTSYGSGNAGGIFGPSLFIGAMLGGAIGQVAHTLLPAYTGNAGAYALVGMGAAFAGIVRTPMTSVIMIFEVTRDYTIIVPLMIANLCSYLLAQRLQKVPIYEALSRQEGIAMPSADHRVEPLSVESAMRPTEAESIIAADPIDGLYVHPDDPLDTALQRMGAANVEELPVLSRTGNRRIGVVTSDEILRAYRRLSIRAGQPAASRDWLPAVAAITVGAILIVSGLVFWQRSRRADLGEEAYRSGQALIAQGRVDEAVVAFRSALAHDTHSARSRAALGLALVQSGHFAEAESYLSEAERAQPANASIRAGLARVALSRGEQSRALDLFRQALAREWSPGEEDLRTVTQFETAKLLAQTGRTNEANALLLTIIGQRADDPSSGKQAAAAIRSAGSLDQAEQAYTMLSERYPADPEVWLDLGEVRYAADKDALARDAYLRAVKADPSDAKAQTELARIEESLALDPTRRGLPVRERVLRWEKILARLVAGVEPCGPTPQIEKAKTLLRKRAASLEASDQKMEAALEIWRSAPSACKPDPLLTHILAKVRE